MFTYTWEQILASLCCTNPDCIDKKSLLHNLETRRDYNDRILDKLYDLKAITIDEYIKYMRKVVEVTEETLEDIKRKIEDAEKLGEQHNPAIYYCCVSILDMGGKYDTEKI